MTEIESIITLARHYCTNNYDYWVNKYSQEKGETPYSNMVMRKQQYNQSVGKVNLPKKGGKNTVNNT